MKRDLKRFFEAVGKQTKALSHAHEQASPLGAEALPASPTHHHRGLSNGSVNWLWELFTGKRHLSPAAKNRLALLAGFQSWADLDDALHGDADASINYEDEPER